MIPWKFIGVILILVFFVFFVGFNIDNNASFRYFFNKKAVIETNVVFIMFFSFLLGILVTLPFVFKRRIQYFERPKHKADLRAEKTGEKEAAKAAKQSARLDRKLDRRLNS